MKFFGLLVCFYSLSLTIQAADNAVIRLGVQASGTLAWELKVLQTQAQFKNQGFQIEPLPVANSEAGKIALQSGEADMIVTDWIWVTRMRSDGSDFTFYPYSTNSGTLMVPETSAIKTIKDLKGKRLGIAGGELDKNWLLLQALAQKENLDLNAGVEKVFGAPPLINEQLKLGRIDAALNYWHFGAQLESQGYRQIVGGKDIQKGLGIQETVPMLGFAFKQSWADSHKEALGRFFQATKEAANLICTSDSSWKLVAPLTQIENAQTQAALRQHYCEGQVTKWGNQEQNAAGAIYALVRKVSGNQLTGNSETLQAGTFWRQN